MVNSGQVDRAAASVQLKEIFGTFYLNESEFAISVSHIQEVVNPPLKYTSLPLSPPYLLGLLNLRGSIIPVVDLRVILKVGEAAQKSDQKIAVLELQGHYIGLLFDRTGELFRSNSEERCEFADADGKSVIRGVFKKDNGQRLVQILDAVKLFDLDNIPKQIDGARAIDRHKLANRRGQRKQCISFVVGPAKCSLGIAEIQEILKIQNINKSSLAVGHCIGTIDLRGTTVPVIDFAALLGYREPELDPELAQSDRRVIVMRLENEFFGLLVDRVESIVSYYQEDLKSFPALNPDRSGIYRGCISLDGRDDILLLASEKIFSNNEIQEITRGHSHIYNATNQKALNGKKCKGNRRTFITFSVENLYAISITEVKEIIERPQNLLLPPGLPSYCKGILNLRGELITIVDAREMYSRAKSGNSTPSKVLVFKKDALHFGLVVDSVEAIVSFSDRDNVKLPEILYKESGGLSSDVTEAIQYMDSKNEEKTILILNSDAIASRVARAA